MCSLCFLPTVIHSALSGADTFVNTKGPGSVIQNKKFSEKNIVALPLMICS